MRTPRWNYSELPRLSNRELAEKSQALKEAADNGDESARKGWLAYTREMRRRAEVRESHSSNCVNCKTGERHSVDNPATWTPEQVRKF